MLFILPNFFKLHTLVKPTLKKNYVASGAASVAIFPKECTFSKALDFFMHSKHYQPESRENLRMVDFFILINDYNIFFCILNFVAFFHVASLFSRDRQRTQLDLIFIQQENFVDNQKCQAVFQCFSVQNHQSIFSNSMFQ